MLKWENLKAILEKRFPGYTFSERRVSRSGARHPKPRALIVDFASLLARSMIVIDLTYLKI